MSRDQQPDSSPEDSGFSDEPTTGPPAGAVSASGPAATLRFGATSDPSDTSGFGATSDPNDTSEFGTTGTRGPSSPATGSRSRFGRSGQSGPDGPGGTGAASGAGGSSGASGAGGTSAAGGAGGAGAASGAGGAGRVGGTSGAGGQGSPGAAAGSSAPGGRARPGARDRGTSTRRTTAGSVASKAGTETETEDRKRRKRRLFVAGISVAAALVVIALCAGGLAVLRAITGFRDDAADAREDRAQRDTACLELETRLNRLVPPGATTTPQTRAIAVRDENAATRIYVGRLDVQRVSDGWRELLDARTSYAEALEAQVKSRTPAFYVAPAARDGVAITDQLARWSPDACAGSIRRLGAPEL
jgi:hypothetical protein